MKRYSNGMYVRLAFSVAAYLEPEILLVDEVLAVGDAEFQKKCLVKMDEVTRGGRTVLFVSHNMAAIKSLSHRTILLEQGRIALDGPAQEVVKHYLGSNLYITAERTWNDIESAQVEDVVRLRAVRAKNGKGEITSEFNIQEPVYIEIEFRVLRKGFIVENWLSCMDESGAILFSSKNNSDRTWLNCKRPTGIYRSVCCIKGHLLNEGTITVEVQVSTLPHTTAAWGRDVITFHVFDPGSGGAKGDYADEWPGEVIRPWLEWKTEYVQSENK